MKNNNELITMVKGTVKINTQNGLAIELPCLVDNKGRQFVKLKNFIETTHATEYTNLYKDCKDDDEALIEEYSREYKMIIKKINNEGYFQFPQEAFKMCPKCSMDVYYGIISSCLAACMSKGYKKGYEDRKAEEIKEKKKFLKQGTSDIMLAEPSKQDIKEKKDIRKMHIFEDNMETYHHKKTVIKMISKELNGTFVEEDFKKKLYECKYIKKDGTPSKRLEKYIMASGNKIMFSESFIKIIVDKIKNK